MVLHKGSMPDTENRQKVMGKILVAGKHLNLRGKGSRREALLEGDKIEWYQG